MHFKHQRKFPLVCTELFIWVWHLKFIFNSANLVLRWWRWSQYVLCGVCTESVTLLWRGSEVSLASPCFEHLSLPLQRVLVCFPVTAIITKTKSDLKERVYLAGTSRSESILDGSRGRGTWDQKAWREVRTEGPGSGKRGGMLFALWLAQLGVFYSSDPPA